MRAIFWAFGLLGGANGVWMLVAPAAWFAHIPADAPDTGPLNAHLVQDVGAAYLAFALGFCLMAARWRRHRDVVLLGATFYGLHALLHLLATAGGALPAHHWLLDIPSVYAPAVILAVMCLPRWWRRP